MVISTAKWSHGSYVSWASFMPIFSFLRPSILNFLGSGTGRTDDGSPSYEGRRITVTIIINQPIKISLKIAINLVIFMQLVATFVTGFRCNLKKTTLE